MKAKLTNRQLELLELADIQLPPFKCKHCRHLYEHEYNSTKYCGMFSQLGTSYGDKKIKSNDTACIKFEKKQPRVKTLTFKKKEMKQGNC